MSIDSYLDRRYDFENYNCLHHASEVWAHLTGQDILAKLHDVLGGLKRAHVAGFQHLARPENPCLALLRRRAGRQRHDFHVGVYLNRRIIHITEQGVQYQPVEVVKHGFTEVRWYR